MLQERQKLLIIDDTPANVQILHEVLHDDYDIFFATSGLDAIRIAQQELPDLILLDIMMPEMDGYEVCSAIKADPHNLGTSSLTTFRLMKVRFSFINPISPMTC